MALGLQTESTGGGDFLPVCKYDSRAGRFFRQDKGDNGTASIDITRAFKAVFDFENIEVGWIMFAAGQAPSFAMVKFGQVLPARPNDNHNQGFRIAIKLSKDCGGDVREFASTARACLRGLDAIHTQYEAEKAAHPGQLPVVILKDTVPVTSGNGDKKSTNYDPIFEIVSWVNRPADLVYTPRAPAKPSAAAQTAATGSVGTQSTHRGPPATGSTAAPPPATQTAAPAGDDFG
jgi:hypothetical protein